MSNLSRMFKNVSRGFLRTQTLLLLIQVLFCTTTVAERRRLKFDVRDLNPFSAPKFDDFIPDVNVVNPVDKAKNLFKTEVRKDLDAHQLFRLDQAHAVQKKEDFAEIDAILTTNGDPMRDVRDVYAKELKFALVNDDIEANDVAPLEEWLAEYTESVVTGKARLNGDQIQMLKDAHTERRWQSAVNNGGNHDAVNEILTDQAVADVYAKERAIDVAADIDSDGDVVDQIMKNSDVQAELDERLDEDQQGALEGAVEAHKNGEGVEDIVNQHLDADQIAVIDRIEEAHENDEGMEALVNDPDVMAQLDGVADEHLTDEQIAVIERIQEAHETGDGMEALLNDSEVMAQLDGVADEHLTDEQREAFGEVRQQVEANSDGQNPGTPANQVESPPDVDTHTEAVDADIDVEGAAQDLFFEEMFGLEGFSDSWLNPMGWDLGLSPGTPSWVNLVIATVMLCGFAFFLIKFCQKPGIDSYLDSMEVEDMELALEHMTSAEARHFLGRGPRRRRLMTPFGDLARQLEVDDRCIVMNEKNPNTFRPNALKSETSSSPRNSVETQPLVVGIIILEKVVCFYALYKYRCCSKRKQPSTDDKQEQFSEGENYRIVIKDA